MRKTKLKYHSYGIKNNYPNVRFKCDTVDIIELKSITLNVCFWLTAITDDFNTEVKILFQGCKRVLSKYCDGVLFHNHVIAVNCLPGTIRNTSRFYVCFEFTLYPIRKFEDKPLSMTMVLDGICSSLYHQIFEGLTNIGKRKLENPNY